MMERVGASLPGLDCGSCGSPSCAALAEDIAQGLGYGVRLYLQAKRGDSGTSGGALGFNQTGAIFYATGNSGGDGGWSH